MLNRRLNNFEENMSNVVVKVYGLSAYSDDQALARNVCITGKRTNILAWYLTQMVVTYRLTDWLNQTHRRQQIPLFVTLLHLYNGKKSLTL